MLLNFKKSYDPPLKYLEKIVTLPRKEGKNNDPPPQNSDPLPPLNNDTSLKKPFSARIAIVLEHSKEIRDSIL